MPSPGPDLSIVYVNYNTTALLLESIASLARLDASITYEVIVVDNASDDFVTPDVTGRYPWVRVLTSTENLGFGKGNNLGAQGALGEFLWILNTDTVIPADNRLHELLHFMRSNPSYGAASPHLTDRSGRSQPAQVALSPTPSRLAVKALLQAAAPALRVARDELARLTFEIPPSGSTDVEVLVAAALFVRADAFRSVGGFSPEFFFFFEDSDLCKKLTRAGYRLRFFRDGHVIHLWGSSLEGPGSFQRRKQLYFASQDVYFRRWAGRPGRLLVKLMRVPLRAKYRLLAR